MLFSHTLGHDHFQLSPHPLERETISLPPPPLHTPNSRERKLVERERELKSNSYRTDVLVEMGKAGKLQLPIVQQQSGNGNDGVDSSRSRGCSVAVSRVFSLKCVVVLMLSVAVFLSAVFWVLPVRFRRVGFDAKDEIKLSATVQAYFSLEKPVSELLPSISRLEYDINEEIGVPSAKVAVLSMHQASVSKRSNVVFGFLSDPMDSSIIPVYLSVLRSTLIELFLRQYNLTLTTSIFGVPSSFEVLKFPGGITVVPERSALILQKSQVLFNFSLNSSIYDITENIVQLKQGLQKGLYLSPNEQVYIRLANKIGSTKDPPVTVEASVVSELGSLQPERLKQIAQVITGSPPAKNLGLDHSVFGKVNEVSLSSYLYHSINAPTPSPSPTPFPAPAPFLGPSYSAPSPLNPCISPASSPNSNHLLPPCSGCYTPAPAYASQPSAPSPENVRYHSQSPCPNSPVSPPPSTAVGSPDCGSSDPPSPSPAPHDNQMDPRLPPHASIHPPIFGPTPHISPRISPVGTYGSRGPSSGQDLVSPYYLPSNSPCPPLSSLYGSIWWFYLLGLLTVHLLWTA